MQLFDNIDDIQAILQDDGIIIHPTDTVWGLACSAESRVGIERMYKIKKQERHQKFILLVSSIDMLKEYVDSLHPRIETLLFHHRQALTLIHPKPKNVLDILIAEDNTIAIRVTRHAYTQQIINRLACPIVSTTANVKDQPAPQNFSDIDPILKEHVDYVALEERTFNNTNLLSVIARYNEEGELDFIRE